MKFVIFFLAALIPQTANAQNDLSPWNGRIDAGGIIAAGNTKLINVNAALAIGYEKDDWRHHARAERYLVVSEDDETEWSVASFVANYKISDRLYSMGAIRYDEHPDTGYDYRASESVGVGLYLLKYPFFTMKLEAGPGARQSRPTGGEKTDETIARGFFEMEWKITGTISFMQNMLVISGPEGSTLESVTEGKTEIAGRWGSKATFTVTGDSDPPEGTKKVDTRLTVGLYYLFGDEKKTSFGED